MGQKLLIYLQGNVGIKKANFYLCVPFQAKEEVKY